jgi:hypothetical protein
MHRRHFLAGALTTAAGLVLPYEPQRVYSFPSKGIVVTGHSMALAMDRELVAINARYMEWFQRSMAAALKVPREYLFLGGLG